MSCFITSGESLGCSDSIGGIKKVYIVGNGGTVTGYTYDADGAITGATSTTGTTIYGFALKRGVSSLTQTLNKSFENGTVFFEQVLNIVLYKYDVEKRNKLKVLSQNDTLQIIAVDQNDVKYLLGQVNYCYLSAGDATSGQALGDRNGFSLTFTAQEFEPARIIEGELATVFAGASIVE